MRFLLAAGVMFVVGVVVQLPARRYASSLEPEDGWRMQGDGRIHVDYDWRSPTHDTDPMPTVVAVIRTLGWCLICGAGCLALVGLVLIDP